VMGDVGIVGADTLLFYETYWVPFTKGAGGIYSGSGTVPANTWAEFLGAVRFDIDSLGSFSVGDIDEKLSGAVISVSNGFGHDGRIIIKSGSGAGFTTGQVQVNNYYLPGKPPSSESLPTGTYMWLVNQAGAKAGTAGTGWFHIDSLLNGYVLGAGTVNTVPLWTASNTLGNSALTQPSATEMSMGTLNGALEMPTGTAAQAPVWANGKLRYNTTSGGFQGGPSGLFLPWADAAGFSNTRIPYSDGAKLISSSELIYSNNELRVGGIADQGSYKIQGGTSFYFGNPNAGGGRIYLSGGGAISYGPVMSQISNGVSNRFGFETNNTEPGSYGGIRAQSTVGTALWAIVPTTTSTSRYVVNVSDYSADSYLFKFSTRAPSLADPQSSNSNKQYIIDWEYYRTSGMITGAWIGNRLVVGNDNGAINNRETKYDFRLRLSDETEDVTSLFLTGANMGRVGIFTNSPTAGLDVNGNTRIRTLPDSLYTYEVRADANGRLTRQVGSFVGAISTSTDASGDIVVAHGMGTTPTSVQVTVTGTTPYVVTVHTIDATNFTVRFYDMTGAAVASTAVTATWHAKT